MEENQGQLVAQETPVVWPTPSRDKLRTVIVRNKEVIESAERLIALLNDHPELDIDVAKLFGIQG